MKTLARALLVATMLVVSVPVAADASHAWGPYHWARTSNPFTVVLVDGVSAEWDAYLSQASSDWSRSRVLDTTISSSSVNVRSCKPPKGQVSVCSAAYGNNGWLGLATISVSGTHITSGSVKVNDTYYATGSRYDTAAWRALVMCQEIGHTFGLDHQDEDFDNANLGTCMDYTDSPDSNQHPNDHDYDQLELIYAHLDGGGSPASTPAGSGQRDPRAPAAWGLAVDDDVYVADVGGGMRVITFVIWVR